MATPWTDGSPVLGSLQHEQAAGHWATERPGRPVSAVTGGKPLDNGIAGRRPVDSEPTAIGRGPANAGKAMLLMGLPVVAAAPWAAARLPTPLYDGYVHTHPVLTRWRAR